MKPDDDTPDMLLGEEIGDIRAYAARALAVLRRIPSPELWTGIYERGLEAALRQHDMDGLAAIASLAIFRFDVLGQFEQSLAQMEFALAMAHGLPDAVVLLHSMRASHVAGHGDLRSAADSLRSARRLLPKVTSPRARVEFFSHSATVSCLSAEVSRLPTVRRAIGLAEQSGEPRLAVYIMSWMIPLMFAAGQAADADPWVVALRLQAQSIPHPFREADTAAFAFATQARRGPSATDVPYRLAAETGNFLATYRLCTLQLRNAVLEGNWSVADQMRARLERVSPRLMPGYAKTLPYLGALVSAYQSSSEYVTPPDPPPVTLQTISGLLAGGEAVAIAGTQRDAVQWLDVLERGMPRGVATALEWPVSRDRVIGLLRARAGSVREAVRAFREAIHWAGQAGYDSEAALAQVQLAEVQSLAEIPSSERARTQLRRAGWMRLQAMGIDPTPHAYAATRALALRDDVSARPQLSPRQVEVLALLAEGLTYREAAARLGTSWRTVSTQAYQSYGRLGVSGKWEAVRAARRLEIL
ncbi:MAG: LuxR C-terminal-related transcriptional regulator [Chloroflexi bacterium]|nr:LuxR C-terminal-related transcriptional regulator [Chloroflexota bacterium]MDA1002147.1 LuxR C-terminal-related transcriptional regulator [Chloroflexota bacterium]